MKLLSLFLMVCSTVAFGQIKPKDTYTVNVNYPDRIVKASVLYNNPKFTTDKSLTYFWYSSNRIMETKGGFDGRILDGLYTAYYISNSLKEKGCFKNGLRDGEWLQWFENGELRELTTWKKGKKQGISKSFNEKGKLISEASFKKDQLNGYQLVYENDKIISKKKFKAGTEQLPKVKKEKAPKAATTNENKSGDATSKKEHRSLFKKKPRKDAPAKVENKQSEKNKKETKTSKEPKTKKTFGEKFRALFKKKDKAEKPAPENKW